MSDDSVGAMIQRGKGGKAFTPASSTQVIPSQAYGNVRGIYNTLLALAKQNGCPAPTMGYLRFEATINQANQGVSFDVVANQGTPTSTERRLKLADAFTPLSWALFLGRVTMAGAAPTAAEFATQKKYTYPESKVFTAASEAANLLNVYNGYTTLRIGQDVVVDSFPNYRFYRVPDSQQGMQFATTAAGVTIQNGGWPNPDWGFMNLTPNITIMGSQTIALTTTFPASVNTAAAAGSYNNLIFEFFGFLTQDGARFNTSKGGKSSGAMRL